MGRLEEIEDEITNRMPRHIKPGEIAMTLIRAVALNQYEVEKKLEELRAEVAQFKLDINHHVEKTESGHGCL